MATVDKFSYPEYYDFPPFFTCVRCICTMSCALSLYTHALC